jgi:hypothetical protein
MTTETFANFSTDASIVSGVRSLTRTAAKAVLAATVLAGLASAQQPFSIWNAHSWQVLEAPNTQVHTLIVQDTYNGSLAQQWVLQRLPGQYTGYEILNVSSGLALDVHDLSVLDGTRIQQFWPNGGTNQLWELHRPASLSGDIPAFEILSMNDMLPRDGICPNLLFTDNFPWGCYKVLEDPGSSGTPGTDITQNRVNNGFNQLWLFAPMSAARIFASGSGNTITFSGFGFDAGAQVCPVLGLLPAPCMTVSSNGTITGTLFWPPGNGQTLDRQYYDSTLPFYITVTAENQTGGVLAITSLRGGWGFY